MPLRNGRDYLYLIWKDSNTRRQFIVGELSKNGQFEFRYVEEVEQAIECGFKPLVCFPNVSKVYVSDRLFSVFSSRLPDKKRKDMNKILEKYRLKEYDEYALLKRSGARLPIDSLSFIDPIFDLDQPFCRSFYVAGVRHYLNCKGQECELLNIVTRGDEVKLQMEEGNSYDEHAVQILTLSDELIGYVPRFYSSGIAELLKDNRKIERHISSVEKDKNCNECIKVILSVR